MSENQTEKLGVVSSVPTDQRVESFSESISFDQRLADEYRRVDVSLTNAC